MALMRVSTSDCAVILLSGVGHQIVIALLVVGEVDIEPFLPPLFQARKDDVRRRYFSEVSLHSHHVVDNLPLNRVPRWGGS